MISILAIDPATQLGWAKWDGKKIKSGTISFENKQFDGAGMRYLKFQTWLSEQLTGVSLVAYEAVMQHSSVYASHIYGGWLCVIQSKCEDLGIPYTGVPVGTVKKFWTGSGSATKKDMIKSARDRGHNPKDDNEADALAILYYARENFT